MFIFAPPSETKSLGGPNIINTLCIRISAIVRALMAALQGNAILKPEKGQTTERKAENPLLAVGKPMTKSIW